MACVQDLEYLSPDERKVFDAIQTEFLSVNDIIGQTNLPLFKVRSVVRKLVEQDMALELNEKYKAKSL